MIDNKIWFSLLLFYIIFWFFKKPKYYVKIASIYFSGVKNSFNFGQVFLYLIFIYLLLASLGISHSGFYKSFSTMQKRYILINDASQSMVSMGLTESLVDANKYFLELVKKSETNDLVASVVFSNNAFISSYLIDDIDLINDKFDMITWDEPPLNGGTSVEKALWAGLIVAAKDSNLKINNFKNNVTGQGVLDVSRLNLTKLKEEINGTCLILFTDGYFAVDAVNSHSLSSSKIVDLCKNLGVTVYIVNLIPPNIMSRDFISRVKKTNGDVFYAKIENLDETYNKIFAIESAPKIVYKFQKQYFSSFFGIVALIYIFIWFTMLKSPVSI